MIQLSFAISSKKTGEEVYRSIGKFESLDSFFAYVSTRYGYTDSNFNFVLSGKELK